MNVPQAHSGNSATQNLILHSFAPAMLLDQHLLIIAINPAMAERLNVVAEQLIGQAFCDLSTNALSANLTRLLLDPHWGNSADDSIAAVIGVPSVAVQIVKIGSEFGGPSGFLVQPDPKAPQSAGFDWETALQGAGQGVWDYNISTGLQQYSKTWHEIRGLSEKDTGSNDTQSWLAKIHPEDLALVQKITLEIDAGLLQTVHYEYRERHALGHWIWIMCRGRAIAWAADGKPIRYVGTDTDISAIKSDQATIKKLSQTEVRWKNALESTDDGLWDLNEMTNDRFHSPQWYKMRGIAEDDPARNGFEDWLSYIHPDDIMYVNHEISQQSIPDRNFTEMEYRERHQLGHWIWISSRGKVVQRDESGRPVRIVGIDTDITGKKASLGRIERISRRLEMALTSSNIGVWEFSFSTNQAEWDTVMRSIYGLPANSNPLPRDIWEQSLHNDDRDTVLAITTAAIKTSSDYILDYRIVRADGEIRHIRSRASHIDDPIDGKKLVGLNWDVTLDHKLAQELKDANAIALRNNIQLEAARALMEYNALHDALTGLPNRRMLDQVQKASVVNPIADDKRFAVLHVDLDRFKQINDTLGHAAGDAALIRTAGILRDSVGENDLVARVGGDEFAVFIQDAPPEAELLALARRIIAKSSAPMKYMHHDCRCGVSIGIAYAFGPDIDVEALLINADMAMYKSKYNGRGDCTVFNEDMKLEALEKKNRSDQLLAALDQNEFFCVYQPQFDCATLQLTGLEALVRWNSPVHGVLAPSEFLPLAEELQIIDSIDRIVLRLALDDLAEWTKLGLKIPRLSINISGRRLSDPCLSDELRQLIIPKNVLSFEFLESIFLDEPNEIQSTNIACIREIGIGIEVDDFGSGHSSIVSLLKLRPDRLKIDRTIVEPVIRSATQRQLVKSIVGIGKLQGISVLAEGVETAEHIKIMQSIGCDELQGYALSRPVPAAQLVQLLLPSGD